MTQFQWEFQNVYYIIHLLKGQRHIEQKIEFNEKTKLEILEQITCLPGAFISPSVNSSLRFLRFWRSVIWGLPMVPLLEKDAIQHWLSCDHLLSQRYVLPQMRSLSAEWIVMPSQSQTYLDATFFFASPELWKSTADQSCNYPFASGLGWMNDRVPPIIQEAFGIRKNIWKSLAH